MVTAEPERNPRVANADSMDRPDVPETPGLVRGGALAAREIEGKTGKLTTPTHRKTPFAGSAPILLHGCCRCSAPVNGGPPADCRDDVWRGVLPEPSGEARFGGANAVRRVRGHTLA